jgi:hypothetical protein
LLLFTAEKFAAVDDKPTKKARFAVGARFSRRSAEAWLWSLQVSGGALRCLKLFIVAKTMRIMISLIIKLGGPHIMKKILLISTGCIFALTAYGQGNGNGNGNNIAVGSNNIPTAHNEATIAQLQEEMALGKLTSVQLTNEYIARINALDQPGPDHGVNSIIELNPDAIALAQRADNLRKQGKVLGPLHGIPVLLKDNIDTGDKMQTTAGSFALFGKPALQDSTVAANLRAGGAVILGKTNLSEWANFRSFESTSGWSGRGGQTNNPYGLDRNPCGSSAGSAAAASANFAGVSFGTETDGSIVCPGNANGVAAIKPTVGLTSRAGVVPITHIQDTVGPHGRTVEDAAAALGVIQSRTFDGRDPATRGVPLGWQGTGKTRPSETRFDSCWANRFH